MDLLESKSKPLYIVKLTGFNEKIQWRGRIQPGTLNLPATPRALTPTVCSLLPHPGHAGPRRGYQFAEQRFRQPIVLHALRVPLHTDNPVRVAGPLDRFDPAIRRLSRP